MNERGWTVGPVAAVAIIVLAFIGFLAVCNGNDDVDAKVASHEYECMSHECGGYDDWGGGSDGNTGYEGGGGRSGDMEQDGENNCRNFCFYGVPMPGEQR